MIDPEARVVFDVNVYLDYVLGVDGSWPLLPDVPPRTENPAADAISLAFSSRFRLYSSPHILTSIARVMAESGLSEDAITKFVTAVVDMCEFSGGAVIEPLARDQGVPDYEDNLIVSLAKDPAVDALVIVSSDRHLLDLGPSWFGRLIMHPVHFVSRIVGA